MIYMGSCESLSEEFKSYIMGKFDMSKLGLLHYFLGLEVDQCTDGIFVSQKKYATDLLKRLNMLHCKSTSTPMNVNEKLVVNDGTGMANAKQFRSIVGGLNYLCHTRPDITFPESVVSKFMHNPSLHHLGEAKRILRYIAGTMDFGIWYFKVSNFKLGSFLIAIGQDAQRTEKVLLAPYFPLVLVLFHGAQKNKMSLLCPLQKQSMLLLQVLLVKLYGYEGYWLISFKFKEELLRFFVTTKQQLP